MTADSTSKNHQVVIEISDRNVHSSLKGFLAAVFYGTCSVATAFTNKALMTTLEFDYPVFIMAVQMLYIIIILELLKLCGVINIQSFTFARARKFLWPAMFYGVNSVLALTALSHMNIAMYGVLKRCVPLSTLFLSMIVLKKGLPSHMTLLSVLMLSMGCLVAGYGDLKFVWGGYLCGAISNFTQAMYLLLVQKYSDKDQSTLETLQLNSFNTLPLLSITCVLNGEVSTLHEFKGFNSPLFYFALFLAVTTGCILNYSLFLCTQLTTALTTSVVGGVKAMVQTLLGIFTFGGVSHNIPTFVGIGMNLSGGTLYIYTKYNENKHRMVGDIKKVLSLSSAEDFKKMTNGKAGGHGQKHIANGIEDKRPSQT